MTFVVKRLKNTSRGKSRQLLDLLSAEINFKPNRHGALNVLVNNASKQYSCKDLAEIDLEKVEDVFQSNILQMIAITKYALPHMSRGDS